MTVITDLTHGYTPPGVYIAEQSQPISTSTGLPLARLTIIGKGQGAQQSTEQVPLRVDGVRLAVKGIIESSIEITVVSDGTTLSPTDYTVDKVPLTENAQDYWIDLHLGEEVDTPDGTTVWVSYQFIPVDYYAPRLFTQPSDVGDVYGPAMNWEGDPLEPGYTPINSPLTLASEIAFANGAGEVLVVPLNLEPSATPEQIRGALSSAYAAIDSDYSSSIIVPLTDGLDDTAARLAASDLRGHLAGASNNGYYRIGVFGPPKEATSSPSEIINSTGLSYRRLIFAYASPEGMLYRSTANGERYTVGHQYLAAAYGARMASLPVAQSLTRQRITGFAGLGSSLTTAVKNGYAAAGVALTEIDRQGRMIVRHGTTTDRSDLVSSEPSVIRARDVMITMVQTGLDNSNLIGSPMDDNSPLSVKSVVSGVLEYCQASAVIVGYTSLQVRVASTNPSVIEVRFSYRPAFPLNYIMVNFSVDLSTGDAEVTETIA